MISITCIVAITIITLLTVIIVVIITIIINIIRPINSTSNVFNRIVIIDRKSNYNSPHFCRRIKFSGRQNQTAMIEIII